MRFSVNLVGSSNIRDTHSSALEAFSRLYTMK